MQQKEIKGTDGKSRTALYYVFPILKCYPDETFEPVGTGFFISPVGLFVTAKHVFLDMVERDGSVRSFLVIAHLLREGEMMIRSVSKLFIHGTTDIAVGFAKPTDIDNETYIFNCSLMLDFSWPVCAQAISSISFPNTIRAKQADLEVILCSDFHTEGWIAKLYRHGRDRTFLPGPCYETSMQIYGGSSGEPVFGPSGRVIGVNSTGYDEFAVSHFIPVSEIIGIDISGVRLSSNRDNDLSIADMVERDLIRVQH